MAYKLKHTSTGLFLSSVPCSYSDATNLSKFVDSKGMNFEKKVDKYELLMKHGINPSVFEWVEC